MKVILVTGANKGIGQAIVKRLLAEFPDTHLLLGSRDQQRGDNAVQELIKELGPEYKDRLEMILIDVGNDESVSAAVKIVSGKVGGSGGLYGVVNNAGGWLNTDRDTIQLNAYSVVRVCEAFAPLLQADGRIVQISSAAGPSYVSKCSLHIQKMLVSQGATFAEAERKVIKPFLNIKEDPNLSDEAKKVALENLGLNDGAYGVAKACVNAYTIELSERYPSLYINSCTPGFIYSDLTKAYAEKAGKTPAEMGMKTTEEGASAAVMLSMTSLGEEERGRYYGSDCVRSPLHKYRSPGTPAYDGTFP